MCWFSQQFSCFNKFKVWKWKDLSIRHKNMLWVLNRSASRRYLERASTSYKFKYQHLFFLYDKTNKIYNNKLPFLFCDISNTNYQNHLPSSVILWWWSCIRITVSVVGIPWGWGSPVIGIWIWPESVHWWWGISVAVVISIWISWVRISPSTTTPSKPVPTGSAWSLGTVF